MEDKTSLTDKQSEVVTGGDIGIQRKEKLRVYCPECDSENVEFLRDEGKILCYYRCKDCGTEFESFKQ